MGKVTGFLEYTREAARSARPPPSASTTGSRSISRFPEENVRTQGARCMDCGVPFCHTGCPLTNIIPDWNDLVYRGRWQEAVRVCTPPTISRNSPAASAPRLRSRLRARHQRAAGHHQADRKDHHRPRLRGRLDPARAARRPHRQARRRDRLRARGLAAAQQLARAGHDVTVFEKNDRIGGLLRYGIPNFKMEKHLIDRRLEQMRAEGVKFETNAHVGGNVAGGRPAPRVRRHPAGRRRRAAARSQRPRPRVEGHPLRHGISAAAEQACAKATRSPNQILATGKRVVIIGGGDTGADCLGTSHRQKARLGHQFELLPKPPDDALAAHAVAAVAHAAARRKLARRRRHARLERQHRQVHRR